MKVKKKRKKKAPLNRAVEFLRMSFLKSARNLSHGELNKKTTLQLPLDRITPVSVCEKHEKNRNDEKKKRKKPRSSEVRNGVLTKK